jgi:hypothetical protein
MLPAHGKSFANDEATYRELRERADRALAISESGSVPLD